MSTVTLTPTSYQFPVAQPGIPLAPLTVHVGLNVGAEPLPVKINLSLAITPYPGPLQQSRHPYVAGVFVAELQESFLQRSGSFGKPVTIASTSGSPGPSTTVTVEEAPPAQYTIAVTFTPPAQPLPGLFEAILVLSGWGDRERGSGGNDRATDRDGAGCRG
jgi:hypothetical protein